jgi:hypothetical protein
MLTTTETGGFSDNARRIAWLGTFQQQLIRWEHQFAIDRGFFTYAVMLLCIRRLPEGKGGSGPAYQVRATVGDRGP